MVLTLQATADKAAQAVAVVAQVHSGTLMSYLHRLTQ
jgi:hypothetical protein